jgi:hypothetical protein
MSATAARRSLDPGPRPLHRLPYRRRSRARQRSRPFLQRPGARQMVAGIARVPGAAGRPAELRRFAGAVSPQPVERGRRNRAKLLPLRLSRTHDLQWSRRRRAAASRDRDRFAAQLGIMSSIRDGQPRDGNIVHAGGVAAGDLGLFVVRPAGAERVHTRGGFRPLIESCLRMQDARPKRRCCECGQGSGRGACLRRTTRT